MRRKSGGRTIEKPINRQQLLRHRASSVAVNPRRWRPRACWERSGDCRSRQCHICMNARVPSLEAAGLTEELLANTANFATFGGYTEAEGGAPD